MALAVLGGTMVSAQSRINGELAGRLHNSVAAAVISFGSGLLLLTVAVCAFRPAREGLDRLRQLLGKGDVRWWECAGGACGAFFVATQGITVGSLGVAVFIVSFVAGQSVSSLLVDRAGLAPGGPRPITPGRAIGTGLAVVAVLLTVSGRIGTPAALGLALLPVLAGFGSTWQTAMNGRVREATTGVMATTWVNFAVGTAALLAVLGVQLLFTGTGGTTRPLPGALPSEPWLYVGGALGIVFIAAAAALVRHIGVLLLGLSMIAGQVGGAVVIDAIAPGSAGRPSAVTVIGALLTLVAVGIAALASGRPSTSAPPSPPAPPSMSARS
ncbi:MAG: DMT family transporter [Hamadaea sp.]|nr:DMT family transporter [Hamadaea sp.]